MPRLTVTTRSKGGGSLSWPGTRRGLSSGGGASERLAQPPLDAVPQDRAAHLARHREAQATLDRPLVGGRCAARELQDEPLAVDARRLALDAQELAARPDATGLRERLAPLPRARLATRQVTWGRLRIGLGRRLGRRRGRHFLGVATVRRLRPFFLRAERILRPLWVAMRARNPCVFFRFRLWG